MQKNEQREALADFLRKHRVSLSPGSVGLPSGAHRRTPGLRREEVAQLANIGFSWYVELEQGRDVHPSAQVLESLAQALRLTPNERRHLFLLAGQALPPQSHPGEETISPELQHLLDDLNPTPAYVLGRRLDYLAWNKAAAGVFAISAVSSAASPHARNLIWRLFTQRSIRRMVPEWERKVRGTLAEFRAARACYPGDVGFEELIEELKQVSPEFCRCWQEQEVSRSLDGRKILEHPVAGHLEFEHVTLQVPNDPDLKITVYTPLVETRAKLQPLLEVNTR
jgi:transcriptional regulator with XRE-family HTH domain